MIKTVTFDTAQKLWEILNYPKPGYPEGSKNAYAIQEFDYSPMLSDSIRTAKPGDIIYDFNGIWPDCDDISDRVISAPSIYEAKEYLFDKFGIFIHQEAELSRFITKSSIINTKIWKNDFSIEHIPYSELGMIQVSSIDIDDSNLFLSNGISLSPQDEIEKLIDVLLDQLNMVLKSTTAYP